MDQSDATATACGTIKHKFHVTALTCSLAKKKKEKKNKKFIFYNYLSICVMFVCLSLTQFFVAVLYKPCFSAMYFFLEDFV